MTEVKGAPPVSSLVLKYERITNFIQPSRSAQVMSAVNADMSLKELLQLVADNHHGKVSLSDEDRMLAVGLLKSKGMDEMDYGEEMKVDKVRLVKRVTGAMGLYFN